MAIHTRRGLWSVRSWKARTGDYTNDAPPLPRQGIAVGGGVRELIESTPELSDEALTLHPGDGGRSDARPADFGWAGDDALAENAASCSRWVRGSVDAGSLELSSEEMYAPIGQLQRESGDGTNMRAWADITARNSWRECGGPVS
jgi:hypothetical protein